MTQNLAQATATEAAKSDTGLRTATVVSSSSAGVVVSINGVNTNPVACVSSYIPAVGDTVAILRQNATWLVLGGSGLVPNGQTTINFTGSSQSFGNSNSTITGSTATFVKRSGATRILARVQGSAYATANAGQTFTYGVNVGASGDQDCGFFWFNDLNSHRAFSAEKVITGVPAGTLSFHLFGRTAGALAVTVDFGDHWSATLQEY